MPDHIVTVKYKGSAGLTAGIFGCVFGILGVFTIGIVFVPLAALCSIVGFLRGISAGSASGIGMSLLAAALTVWGFLFSPTLWPVAALLVHATSQ